MSTGGMPAPAAPQPALGDSLLPQVGQPGGWKAWVSRPENRAALVQAGIELLQPLGVGQTPLSRVGTAIGSGMEARDRAITGQQADEQRQVENAIAQQEADARTVAADAALTAADARAKDPDGLTALQRITLERNRLKEFRSYVAAYRKSLFPGDPMPDMNTLAEMFEQENATAPALPGGGGSPSLADAVPGAPADVAPPVITEGQTATGPGGQKIIYRSGQWVPLT